MRNTDSDKQRLRAHGYHVKVHTKYHWQVTQPPRTIVVDVWPTAKKFLVHFERGPAPRYQDILVAMESCFDPPDAKNEITSDEQLEAWDQVMKLRRGGLQYVRDLLEAIRDREDW